MSRNFTADVDTQREYFNATYFNNSGQNQLAQYETSLLKPFFLNPDNWKLAINRMRIPLSGIPLTRNNIPFNQWTLGIDYRPVSSGAGGYTSIKTVKQYNEKSEVIYETYSVSQSLAIEKYNITQSSSTLLSSIPTTNTSYTNTVGRKVRPVFSPDFSFLLAINSNNKNTVDLINVIDGTTNLNISVSQPQFTTNEISALSFDNNNNIYIAVTRNDGGPLVYSFKITGEQILTYIPNTPAYRITSLSFDIASPAYIYVGTLNTMAQSSYLQVVAIQIGSANMVNTGVNQYARIDGTNYNPEVIVATYPNPLFYMSVWNSQTNTYRIIASTQQNQLISTWFMDDGSPPPDLLGVNQYGGLVINGTVAGYSGIQTLNPQMTPPSFVFNPVNGCASYQYSSAPVIVTIPAGPYDIFTYQEFLNQINSAFTSAFNDLKTQKGALILPTEPPSIIYNPESKLFNLIVEGQYLTKNADGSNQYTIFMNNALWNMFYFPSSGKFQSIYNSIILQNYGLNAVAGTGSSNIPQYIYVQQENSTIYAFYDLVRIIVGTLRIPVSGDGEGKTFSNQGNSSNNAISMITDIVPDTSTLTPSTVLIYIPAGILRWYNLYAQQPFEKIDLNLQYETKDGNIYPIQIVNGEFFSVKLEFKKGAGDF